ncbi:helix-turn-helix domain-containing protein [Rhodococcus sp. 3A]
MTQEAPSRTQYSVIQNCATMPPKNPPAYAISSVDHALRLAAMLHLKGELTVAEAADRLGVARSRAHRLLQMLVYRDF